MTEPPPFLSDAQFAILMSAIAAFCGTLIATAKWAVSRVVKVMDDDRTERKEHSQAFVLMTAKVDQVHDWMQDHTPVEEMREQRRRTSTPIRGVPTEYSMGRPGTKGGDR